MILVSPNDPVEVLTPHGWLSVSGLNLQVPVAQFDAQSSAVFFAPPTAITSEQVNAAALRWETQFHQGLYLSDQPVLFRGPRQLTWRSGSASSVAARGTNNTYIPASGFLACEGLGAPEAWIRLAEAVRADGYVAADAVSFNLKKQRKIERLQQLCRLSDVSISISFGSDGRTRVRLLQSRARAWIIALLLRGKRFGRWIYDLSLNERRVWIEECRYWDGAELGGTSWSLSTADRGTADWFQIMCHTSGYRYAVRELDNQKGFNAHNAGATIFNASVREALHQKIGGQPAHEHFAGTALRLSLSGQGIMVRRNGTVSVMGC